jgi:uncharacterized iron-regulated membrane protein
MADATFTRRVWRWHFWAGLVATPTLLIVAVTGGLYVFRIEIEDAIYADATFVEPTGSPLSAAEQLRAVQASYAGRTVSRMVLSEEPARATTFLVNQPPRADGADPGPSTFVWLNPYTGVVTGERSNRAPFFGAVLELHRSLFSGTAGRLVVELTTSWMLVLLVTGVWLWLPKRWQQLSGVWYPRLRGHRYRSVRDLHAVGGMYLAPVLALVAFTGLLYGTGAIRLWNAASSGAFALPRSYLNSPPSHWPTSARSDISVNHPVALAQERWPGRPLHVQLPRKPTDAFVVTARGGWGPTSVGVLGVDQYSGAILCDNRYEDLRWYQQARLWALPFHEGSVIGWPSKVVALLACLGLACLAGTGLILTLLRHSPFRLASARSEVAPPRGAVAAIVVCGLLLPTVGATIVLVVAGDYLNSYLRSPHGNR